jgi:UDP:flavonoid glycosyltransferase YjiC (YdhE family)
MSPNPAFDVLMMSDLRFPGGTSASIAQEIRAQARAGYRTGVVHVHGPLIVGSRAFNPLLRDLIAEGAAELVLPDAPVHARLALLRHPSVFGDPPAGIPHVSAETTVMVVNQPAHDRSGEIYYDVDEVDATVTQLFGHRPLWAPIGPQVRPTLTPDGAPLQMREQDWVNIIDVDEWAVERTAPVGDRPVIGRHSRPDPNKWPRSKSDLLAAYPTSEEFRVSILGGASAAADVLGSVPDAWNVVDFGAMSPQDFLAGIDFFVYFHDPDWIEAFGRTILEALASGAVAVLPEHFRTTFGDAALYAQPQDVAGLVRGLYADWPAYLAQSRRGQEFVRERFGHEAHLARVRELIGAPSAAPAPAPHRRRLGTGRSRVMFVSSNGAGMGHLTRLLALARRASPAVEPMFVSLSQAVEVVRSEGFAYEYVPSRESLDLQPKQWNPWFVDRFEQLIGEHRPKAVVFDGTWPYEGLIRARANHPEIVFVWSRRGMWKPDVPFKRQMERAELFDLVVEPGDFAAAADLGPTARATDAVRVPPVTFLDESELLPRDQAARELGLDPDRKTALVTLGAGNINDLSSDLGAVVTAIRRHPEWQVAITKPIIATGSHTLDDVHSVSIYPLSRYSHAFDFAVAASGYNSYHELIAFGVPAAYVPNMSTRTDDQMARAAYAEAHGVGLCVPEVTPESMARVVDILVDDERRSAMAQRCRDQYPGNGAAEAMGLIEDLVRRRQAELALPEKPADGAPVEETAT